MEAFYKKTQWWLVNDSNETIALTLTHYTQPLLKRWDMYMIDAQGHEYKVFADCNQPEGTFFKAYSTAPKVYSSSQPEEDSLDSIFCSSRYL